MAGSVHDQIITSQNQSAHAQAIAKANSAGTVANTGSKSSVSSQQFLHLLTEQLKYQDPMNPMDNSEMLAQEAQFATLEQMEALASNFSQFSTMYQANSLLGQNVEVMVDGNATSGKVDFVDYSDKSGAAVSIKGKLYPLASITKVYPENSETAITQEDTNFLKAAANSIATNVGEMARALFGYENGENNSDTNSNPKDDTTTNTENNS